jgi:hypothetical protein
VSGRTSSPAATGGAGTFFEQHVNAYWLAQLLVRAIPPILIDCVVAAVHFQTEHLGWKTDDFLIIGECGGAGKSRKLAGQVKRSFAVSATDEDCKAAIEDFWRDFRSAGRFSPDCDRFALVVQRGSNTLLKDFTALLDCARVSRDGAEFEQGLRTEGFISAKAVAYCNELRKIIGTHESGDVSAAEIWPFLRVLHVIHLDLYTSTAQTEAQMKTLLAYTTAETDGRSVADASWNELLALAAQGMGAAASFRRNDLPEALRNRHAGSGGLEQSTLRTLSEHTAPILRGIHSMIGGTFHLARAAIVQKVLQQLESHQIVLLSGPAGSGKSVIAKDALALISLDYFTFGFRAEELAQAHFDATLQSAKIPANNVAVQALLASQDRKVILIDSVERLLEKSTRDAFGDLLGLTLADKSLRILVTCRDYSTDLVRDCLLASFGIGHFVIDVPQLSDPELSEIETVHPALKRPLADNVLRRILRNPYILDKALQIPWEPDLALPQSVHEFRRLFWQQIVRADQNMANGMPQRREVTFEAIALRRARALTVYVLCADLDVVAIESLRRDSLLVSSETSPSLTGLAHDVLEDWAILLWIEKEHVVQGGSFRQLAASIGPHPAIRRAYRTWVAELLDRDANAADQLFQAAVMDTGVLSHFRDDTLVSLLRAPTSAILLERNSAQLLANSLELFRRVIHLLRVACVTAPSWLPPSRTHVSLFNVPAGSAWAAVLRLVEAHKPAFAPEDALLLLGLIEDWARGVTYWLPYPAGAEAAAAIAHWLLPGYSADRDDSPGKRIMKVIAKIPLAAPAQFETLMRGGDDEENRTTEEFRDLISSGMDGTAAGRDVPDILIEAAKDYLLCDEEYLRNEDRFYGSSLDLELTFGLKEGLRHNYFPASALRGPWIQLLRSHPDKGIEFFLQVFNHSADWYAHPRVNESIEAPVETELTFADGTTRRLWMNGRLWGWYRGITVGPYVLQSLLMAFERWLLEYAKTYPNKLDATLTHILRGSDNAALTAVVASVATAYPHASGEALLVLLSSPLCIRIDKHRLATDMRTPSVFSGLLPTRAENQIYDEERKQADGLPHRRQDLEHAMTTLQFGPLAPRVHQILDRHRDALPAAEQQTDDHRTWRLAIHRMDIRQYTVTEVEVPAPEEAPGADEQQGTRRMLRLDLNEPEEDVKEMAAASSARFDAMNARLGLQMWAYKVFNRDHASCDPSLWRQRLLEAQAPDSEEDSPTTGPDMAAGGPGTGAAICIRDHWEEISASEQGWCIDRVCVEVMAHADEWNDTARVQRYDIAADRPSAWVLPLLLGKTLTQEQRSKVEIGLAAALTHPVHEVRWYSIWGIAEQLWAIDRTLALRSVNALAMEAAQIQEKWRVEEKRPYNKRREMSSIAAEAAANVRQAFWKANGIAADSYEMLDVNDWFGTDANSKALTILSRVPNDDMAVAAFARASGTLVAWWDSDHDRRHGERRERDHDAEAAIMQRLEDFLLRTSVVAAQSILEPILGATDRHTQEVPMIIRGLTAAEDRHSNTPQFWLVWNLFADRIRKVGWLSGLDGRYSPGDGVISAIFLGSGWKDEVRHWKSLEGYAHHVHKLFEELPATATVLEDYVRFLYHIGEQSLPGAFVLVSKQIHIGDSRRMLGNSNTMFMLEVLLQRNVYGKPLELKRELTVRDAVLALLDLLVENGSSAAFRMRDDFVTPASS